MTKQELLEMEKRLAVFNKDIRELNAGLKKHFEETGVKDAFLFEPIHECYWNYKDKIAICNIESYDDKGEDGKGGIRVVTSDTLTRWYRPNGKRGTLVNTVKFCQLLSDMFEEKYEQATVKDIKEIDQEYWGESLEYLTQNFFYLNLRLTASSHVDANEAELSAFYSDEFYRKYFQNLIKAAEVKALVVTGEIGCHTINKIYPDLHLEFCGSKVHDGILFFSMKHPSRISHEDIVASANEFMNAYIQ